MRYTSMHFYLKRQAKFLCFCRFENFRQSLARRHASNVRSNLEACRMSAWHVSVVAQMPLVSTSARSYTFSAFTLPSVPQDKV